LWKRKSVIRSRERLQWLHPATDAQLTRDQRSECCSREHSKHVHNALYYACI